MPRPEIANVGSRIRACIECRQQKLRCDAHLDPCRSCSRCRRTGTECIISDKFQRSKRSSKAEMQRELEQLRASASARTASVSGSVVVVTTPAAEECSPGADGRLGSPQPSDFIANQSIPQAPSIPVTEGAVDFQTPARQQVCQSRNLAGFHVPAQKISECFSLYFEHYHPQLPILEPGHGPDQYYLYSPLVFWSIIAVGSRRYAKDPTILDGLSSSVVSLALQSTAKTSQYIRTIQGLVLLCNWSFPVDTIYHDVSAVLAGAATQLAIQNGLHMFSKRQDFTRNSLRKDENEEMSRAKLWSYCKIVCQRVSCFSGLHPLTVPDAFDREHQHGTIIASLPAHIYWEQKLHKLLTNALATLMDLTSAPEDSSEYGQLRLLIDVFDGQIRDISGQVEAQLKSLDVAVARLYVCAFEFFGRADEHSPVRLANLYAVARAVIDTMARADEQDSYVLYSPHVAYRALMLVGTTLLRIARSGLLPRIDAESTYFENVRLLKRRSLQNDDLDARGAVLLTQLWRSSRVFVQPDGTINSLRVRLRSRGAMSINYDCYWYWVAEFKRQSDPYSPRNPAETTPRSSQPVSQMSDELLPFGFDGNLDQMLQDAPQMDAFWPEWEWPLEPALQQ